MNRLDRYINYLKIYLGVEETEDGLDKVKEFVNEIVIPYGMAIKNPDYTDYLNKVPKEFFSSELFKSIPAIVSTNEENDGSEFEYLLAYFALNGVWKEILKNKDLEYFLQTQDLPIYSLFSVNSVFPSEVQSADAVSKHIKKVEDILNNSIIQSLIGQEKILLSDDLSFSDNMKMKNVIETFVATEDLLNKLGETLVMDLPPVIKNLVNSKIKTVCDKLVALYRPAFDNVVFQVIGFNGKAYRYKNINSEKKEEIEFNGTNKNSLYSLESVVETYLNQRGMSLVTEEGLILDTIPISVNEFPKLEKSVQFLWPHYALAKRHIPYFKETSDGKYTWHSKLVSDFKNFENELTNLFLRPLFYKIVYNGLELSKSLGDGKNPNEEANRLSDLLANKLYETGYSFFDFSLDYKKMSSFTAIFNDYVKGNDNACLTIPTKNKSGIEESFETAFRKGEEELKSASLKVCAIFKSDSLTIQEAGGIGTYFKLKYIVNVDLAAKEISFAYKQYNPIFESYGLDGFSPNVIIGKNEITDVPVTLNLAAEDNIVSTIMAGSGSGKGVLTLAILATLLLSNKSVIYADFKPDMAGTLWELAGKLGSPIYAIDGKGLAAKKKTPHNSGYLNNGAGFNYNMDDFKSKWSNILSEDKNIKILPYLKTMQLFAALGLARMRGNAPDNKKQILEDDEIYLILDEAQMANTIYSGAISKVYSYLKSNKKNKETEEYKRAQKFNDVFIDGLADEMKDVVITTGRMSKMHIIIIGQQTDPGQWATPQGIWKQCTFGYMVGNLKYKLQGPRAGSSPTYGVNKNLLSEEDRKLVRGYWVLTDNARSDQQEDVQRLKSYLILNENDYNLNVKTKEEYAKHGHFVQGLFKGVATDEAAYKQLVQDVTVEDELGNIVRRPEVGFAGMLEKYLTLDERKQAVSKSYNIYTAFLTEAGIVGPNAPYQSLEDYLYSFDDNYFFTANELAEAFFSGLDAIMQNRETEEVANGKIKIDKALPELFSVRSKNVDGSYVLETTAVDFENGDVVLEHNSAVNKALDWCNDIDGTVSKISDILMGDYDSRLAQNEEDKKSLEEDTELDNDSKRDRLDILNDSIAVLQEQKAAITETLNERKLYLKELKEELSKNKDKLPIYLSIPSELNSNSSLNDNFSYKYNFIDMQVIIDNFIKDGRDSTITDLKSKFSIFFNTAKLQKEDSNSLEIKKSDAQKLIKENVKKIKIACYEELSNKFASEKNISNEEFSKGQIYVKNKFNTLENDLIGLIDNAVKEQVGINGEEIEQVINTPDDNNTGGVPVGEPDGTSGEHGEGARPVEDERKQEKIDLLYAKYDEIFKDSFQEIDKNLSNLNVKTRAKGIAEFEMAKSNFKNHLQYWKNDKLIKKFFESLEKELIENSIKEEAKAHYIEKYNVKMQMYINQADSLSYKGPDGGTGGSTGGTTGGTAGFGVDEDNPLGPGGGTSPKSPMESEERRSPERKGTTVNGHKITSPIDCTGIVYDSENIDSISNVKATNKLTALITQDIKTQFGGVNNIESIAVTSSGCLVINEYTYTPQLSQEFLNSLGDAVRMDVENGQIYKVVNLGRVIRDINHNIFELAIETPKVANSSLFKSELGVRNNYGVLFKTHSNLQTIYLPDQELNRNNPNQQNSGSGLGIGSKLANLFRFGGNKNSGNYTPNPSNDYSGSDTIDRIFESKPVRILTGALGWTLGCKAVVFAATVFGPWGLLFGAFAAAGAYNEIKKSQNQNNYNRNNNSQPRNSGGGNKGQGKKPTNRRNTDTW